ncbi:MAG TPA: SAM-dependent methyltransferase, partial [Bacteroidales bacterium]|nr:SAM-dependent methyltransferase [Bacteroidales bacterium]
MEQKKIGAVYLIPSFMGEQSVEVLFPEYNKLIISKLNYFIVENARTARRSLKSICSDLRIDTLHIQEIDKHVDVLPIDAYLEPLKHGYDIGIMSEAGMPCIADPGNLFVAKAHS